MNEFASTYLLSHQAFFVYGILLVEFFLHTRCQPRPLFPLRALAGVICMLLFGLLVPSSSAVMGSTIIFCASILLLWFLFQNSVYVSVFLCVAAYLLQNTAMSANKLITVLFGLQNGLSFIVHGLCLLAAALIGYFVLLRRMDLDHLIANAMEANHLAILMPVSSLCVIITLNTLFGESGLDDNPFCRIALIATCCFAIILQYSELKRSHLSVENRIIQQLLNAERSQYYISKETIDILNAKHHDLKHQISAIRSLCQEEQSAALQEVENAIDVYNIVAKTGNEALDAVLTEKMLFCEKHSILMTYMVDQTSLSFINILDLYSLFGNILDNAIESVMKEDEDKRVITLQICQKSGFLSIHLENYCKEPPKFRNGLPRTTKQDKQNHGFGVKSVCYLVQRYQGHTVFQVEHEMFLLDIMIPIPN